MQLYGRSWTRRELEGYMGRLEQVGGIRRYVLDDGPERGLEVIEVRTGAGLEFTVMPTKGLDFGLAKYGGVPVSWQSPQGDVHPMYYQPGEDGWLRTASGGLMMTCGLVNVGSPSHYNGRQHGLHGRIHHTPAREVSAAGQWDGDDYEMTIRGVVEEVALFGERLRLSREICARLGENRIVVRDRVENAGFDATPHMLLYHFNFGYPFLSPDTIMHFPKGTVAPREPDTPLDGYDRWQEPEQGCRELVYYHQPEARSVAQMRLVQPRFPQAGKGNTTIPLAIVLSWHTDTLPRLVQWKMPAAGVYALGVEPASCGVAGIAAEEAAGTLRLLQPGEAVGYEWELNIG